MDTFVTHRPAPPVMVGGSVLVLAVLALGGMAWPRASTGISAAGFQAQTTVRCTYPDGSTIMLTYEGSAHAASITPPGVLPRLSIHNAGLDSGGATASGGYISPSSKTARAGPGMPTMTGWSQIADQDTPVLAIRVASGFGWTCSQAPSI